ncbi:Toll-like receptor 7 [Gryllus bimaculatus]|nr:Toll-like receptor 7 [Gryllus bimaculatus]
MTRVHSALGALLALAASLAACASALEARPCRCVRFTTDCSSRQLTRVREGTVCSHATKLDLSNNDFREIPPGLGVNLTEIDLSRNRINVSTPALRAMSRLRVLNLKVNSLTSLDFLPDTCVLRSLDVSVNDIAGVGSALWRCSQLETLDLSFNKITSLNESGFAVLTRLRRLDLSGNKLSHLPNGAFLGLSQLSWLSLRACGLSALPDGAFRGLSALRQLHLQQNPQLATPLAPAVLAPLTQLQGLELDRLEGDASARTQRWATQPRQSRRERERKLHAQPNSD